MGEIEMITFHSARCAAIGAVLACASQADAAEIRVFSSGAPSVAAKALAAKFSAESGHTFAFTIGQPATIRQKLLDGEMADVVIVPAPVLAGLEKSGKVRPGTVVDVARVGIGVVVREGAPQPDISTAAAIRKMLIEAHAIAYPDPTTGGGFTGKAIARMIEQMGIADIVKPKLTLGAAINGGVKLVADGKVEVGLFNISEILPIKGVTLVGPLPSELQNYIVFAAGISAGAAMPDPAGVFIKLMASPAAREAWTSAGLQAVDHM
jgi:molybdate transport system substrate-binding protein